MRKFKKLAQMIRKLRKHGSISLNKEYKLVVLLSTRNGYSQLDLFDEFTLDSLSPKEGFWIESQDRKFIFCGYTLLCLYMYLYHMGLNELIEDLYGNSLLLETERKILMGFRYDQNE